LLHLTPLHCTSLFLHLTSLRLSSIFFFTAPVPANEPPLRPRLFQITALSQTTRFILSDSFALISHNSVLEHGIGEGREEITSVNPFEI